MPLLINMLKQARTGKDYFEADLDPGGLERFSTAIHEAKTLGLVTYSREIHTLDHLHLTAIEGVAITLAGKSYLRTNG